MRKPTYVLSVSQLIVTKSYMLFEQVGLLNQNAFFTFLLLLLSVKGDDLFLSTTRTTTTLVLLTIKCTILDCFLADFDTHAHASMEQY